MARECYYCGYPNRDDAARCINCGLELNKYWDKSNGKIELMINIKKIVEYILKI